MPSVARIDHKALRISSPAFKPDGNIPSRYTCEGEDINPPLDIKQIPAEAKSMVLIIEDPDAPMGTWLHWLVWNIPIVHYINENDVPGDQGLNDFGKIEYGGPCPPDGMHRYYFNVYALDDLLDLPEGSSRRDVEAAMQNHIIAYGQLMGVYKKSRRS